LQTLAKMQREPREVQKSLIFGLTGKDALAVVLTLVWLGGMFTLLAMVYAPIEEQPVDGVWGKPPLAFGTVLIDGERSIHNYVYGGDNVHLHNTRYVVTFFEDDLEADGERYDRTMVQTNLLLRGAFKTSAVRFVDGEHVVGLDDHILMCEPDATVHLGNASSTPDGMRLIVRALDAACTNAHPMLQCNAPLSPKVSCAESGCALFMILARGDQVTHRVDNAEFVFNAARNAWYALYAQ
jgi:hypothetical protein